ncbi:MAG: hypothetical protein OXR72_17100 [Gemmatimonadota bacterium]|nr:hypothetical protein [Gemmatimonadota bacterium]
MDRDDVRQRLEALEDKLRWQKRMISGLLVVFLFSATPALTRASKWVGSMLPAKLASLNLKHGTTTTGDARFGDVSLARADLPLPEAGTDALSKFAPEQIVDAGDTLRVRTLHIVNASGEVVAALGSGESGDGSLVIGNSNGNVASIVGVDANGHGTLGVLNAAGRVAAAMGADPSEQANGWVDVRSATGSASALFFDNAGDGAMAVFNTDNTAVSGFGIDNNGAGAFRITNAEGGVVAAMGANDNGHGLVGFLNASERVVAGMGADSTGIGGLGIEGGRFSAFVDENGNGVARTRGQNEEIRWSSEAPLIGDTGTSTGLIGDFDGDGDVDFNDFLTFARNFGKTSG